VKIICQKYLLLIQNTILIINKNLLNTIIKRRVYYFILRKITDILYKYKQYRILCEIHNMHIKHTHIIYIVYDIVYIYYYIIFYVFNKNNLYSSRWKYCSFTHSRMSIKNKKIHRYSEETCRYILCV
jgi:hypothetical protein